MKREEVHFGYGLKSTLAQVRHISLRTTRLIDLQKFPLPLFINIQAGLTTGEKDVSPPPGSVEFSINSNS